MDEASYAYHITAGVIVAYFAAHVVTRRFDPFAPTWLFLMGFTQIYVVQAIRYHEWGVGVRGKNLVASADLRAAPGPCSLVSSSSVTSAQGAKAISRVLPRPPRNWSSGLVAVVSPLLVLWGLFCAAVVIRSREPTADDGQPSFFSNFPFVMLVAGVLLIVTGRTIRAARPAFLPAGVVCCFIARC